MSTGRYPDPAAATRRSGSPTRRPSGSAGSRPPTLSRATRSPTATSGLDAGLALSEFKPDSVVMDVMLDDIPGATLVARIRQSPVGRSTRIIAISGKTSADDVREIKAAGANVFLAKPFEMRDLVKSLKLPIVAKG